MSRAARLAAYVLSLCLAVLVSTGCAVQSQQLRQSPPQGLASRIELADTPFFAQTDYHCGPASLATVLGAAGVPIDPDALISEVYLPARRGSLQIEMLASARRHGLIATVIEGSLTALLAEVAAGHPVLVLQNLGLSWAPSWHYAVVVGYDLDAHELILRSGTMKRQRMSLRTFEHTWRRAGFWGFVALPAGKLAISASEQATLNALLAFERQATPEQSIKAYLPATRRWPESLTLAMGLSHAQYAAGDHQAAEHSLRETAQRHQSAAAYNNLAMVLLAQQQCQAAAQAADQAQRLAHNNPSEEPAAIDAAITDTLSRIRQHQLEHPHCR